MFGIYLQITSHVKKQENMIQDEEKNGGNDWDDTIKV